MYNLSDKQMDFILSDIGARGVEMESLQLNLLDHICCIIEKDLEENGDFERFYQQIIRRFYKDALWEIEEETISVLTFKNYYAMKKSMIVSGTFSAITMVLGIIFKFMHWQGSSLFIILGIVSASLFFLPLFFTLKAREKQNVKDKLVIAIGAVAASLISLSILFKVMHWPWAGTLGSLSVVIMLVVFLPIYFFGGIRHPESKINTIASSILIILGWGLMYTLIRTPKATDMMYIRDTYAYLANEQIVKTEKQQLKKLFRRDSSQSQKEIALSEKIDQACEDLKSIVLVNVTGHKTIDSDFEGKGVLLQDNISSDAFADPFSEAKLRALIAMVDDYNARVVKQNDPEVKQIHTKASFIEYFKTVDMSFLTTLSLLNQISRIQMVVFQNQEELLAAK